MGKLLFNRLSTWGPGVPLRLNAGVPSTLVAEWAGHGVEVLLKIYAKCIAGQDHVWEAYVDRALRG